MATRSKAYSPERFSEQLEQGWPTGLTVLTGDDLFELDAVQRQLLEKLVPPDDNGMTLSFFGQEKVDIGTVVGAARSAGMFSTRRVVFARDLSALEGEPDSLLAYAKAPPPESYLIVRAPEIDKRRKLHKALLAKGHVLTFALPAAGDTRRMLDDVKRVARRKGLTLPQDTAEFLAVAAGHDGYRLDSELEKLRAYKGDEKPATVTLEEAQELVASGDILSGWEIAEAVLARNRDAGWAAAARLIEAGAEPLQILGGIAWQSRMMLQAKGLLERGVPQAAVKSKIRGPFSTREAVVRGVQRYSLEELRAFPAHLAAADLALKGSPLDGGTILERLVEQLTGRESS